MSTTTKGSQREPTSREIDDAAGQSFEIKNEEKKEKENIKSSGRLNQKNQIGDIYIVGHHYGSDDQWPLFRDKEIWEQGRDEDSKTVLGVKEGALLVLKSTDRKGNVLFLQGLGIVKHNPGNGHHLEVNWVVPMESFEQIRLEGFAAPFSRTITRVSSRYRDQIINAIGGERLANVFGITYKEVMAGLSISAESEEVFLSADAIANEFANVIHRSKEISNAGGNKTSQEDRFYGIFGQWGRGKTKFWNLLKDSLTVLKGYRFIEFHAWKYQETPAVWAYLYEKFADEYFYKRGPYPWYAAINLLQSFWLAIFRNPGSVFLFFVSLVATIGIIGGNTPNLAVLDWYEKVAGSLGVLVGLVATYRTFSKPIIAQTRSFGLLAKRKDFKNHLGVQHEAQEELAILLRAWYWWWPKEKKKNIVLFIDDIDRCDELKIIQIVDSIRVMLNEPDIRSRLIVIAAIDERILCQAIRKKYRGFIESGYETLAAEYMDKLFIVGIKLGKLSEPDKQEILRGFTNKITEPKQVEVQENVDSEQGSLPNTSEVEKPNEEEAIEISEHQLTLEEEEMLLEKIGALENATPRSIRGFLIKYRLARNLYNLLGKSSATDQNDEIAELVIESMNLKIKQDHPFSDSNLEKVISMINYYHDPVGAEE